MITIGIYLKRIHCIPCPFVICLQLNAESEDVACVFEVLMGGGVKPVLLPYLRDYLSIHPLFQLKDFENEYSDIYYLSKTVNHKYAKEIYVALVLAIQEYMLKMCD